MTLLIPSLPYLAFLILITMGRRIGPKVSPLVAIGAMLGSFGLSLRAFFQYLKRGSFGESFLWLPFGPPEGRGFGRGIYMGTQIDPLALMMLFVVTVVGTLIFIYAIGYMQGDPRVSRFFAYLSLFAGSMLGLVLADNFLTIFMFWELVGLCSYLLIGFWFEKPAAAKAGKKAFITTRIGDVGFLIGILTFFWWTGSFQFEQVEYMVWQGKVPTAVAAIGAVLIFCGAVGKSAQFPLHVWLPDAMEGPTPVSALIHAATMVAAGVYLVARTLGIFFSAGSPIPLHVVAAIGAFTAFLAASMALTSPDIKRILAYSTISQLGFMMAALGVLGYTAGTFHLMTHAFFKALLFMCAGSVLHATHVLDIGKLGGLFKKMKWTGTTALVGCLAIAGVPPLAGFWSKDEILTEAFKHGHYGVFGALLLTAAMTAFYMFRWFFRIFWGPERHEVHAHESPAVMTVPLAILAFFSATIGLVGSPLMGHWFQKFIGGEGWGQTPLSEKAMLGSDPFIPAASVAAAVIGIGLAYVMYVVRPDASSVLGRLRSFGAPVGRLRMTEGWWGLRMMQGIYRFLLNKWWFDEVYQAVFIRPAAWAARALYAFDMKVIDGAVNGAGWAGRRLGDLDRLFDEWVVDGAVNGVANACGAVGGQLRKIQTGVVQNYLLIALSGIVATLITWLVVR